MSPQAQVLSAHLAFPMFSRLDFRAMNSRVVEPNDGHSWIPESLLGGEPFWKDVRPSSVCMRKKCLIWMGTDIWVCFYGSQHELMTLTKTGRDCLHAHFTDETTEAKKRINHMSTVKTMEW